MEPADQIASELEMTAIIVQRYIAGDDHALTEYLGLYYAKVAYAKVARSAGRMIRRLGIDDADLDGEGAANLAFTKIDRLRQRGRLTSINNGDDFAKLTMTILRRLIRDLKKRRGASRRGGDGALSPARKGAAPPLRGFTRTDLELDALQSPMLPADLVILAKLELEALLERVRHPTLRKILMMRFEGSTRNEIAQALGVTERCVQRKFGIIRRIHSRLNSERDR
jgi:DNA-directed RNA polymerase specialized sigma24 family protein